MAPISETGDRDKRAGFTLTELLVVLAIVGLLGSFVLIAVPDSGRSLVDEAESFAARLVHAKEEAVLTNRTIEVRVTQQGYDFDMRRGGERQALDQRPFGPVAWSRDTTATLSTADERSRIVFDSTGIATPAEIDLFRVNVRLRVIVDAVGNVKIDARGR